MTCGPLAALVKINAENVTCNARAMRQRNINRRRALIKINLTKQGTTDTRDSGQRFHRQLSLMTQSSKVCTNNWFEIASFVSRLSWPCLALLSLASSLLMMRVLQLCKHSHQNVSTASDYRQLTPNLQTIV